MKNLKKATWQKRTNEGLTDWVKRDHGWVPYYIETAPDVPSAPWSTIWHDLSQSRQAKAHLTEIFGRAGLPFETPKPVDLVRRVLNIAAEPDSVILDSFAGSGTTAHAVLAANQDDGGNRQFILIECEDYADSLTAERVRRVIKGYKFTGTQREELHRDSLTFTSLKKAEKLLDHVASIENLEGHRFDRIEKKVKDGELTVTGEKSVTERTEGLGGSFTYCTLGPALELDKLLSGESLPSFDAVAALVFHMATNLPLPAAKKSKPTAGCNYLGDGGAFHVWLIYQPDMAFLKSRDAALTLARAEALVQTKGEGSRHLVFAPAKFVSQRILIDAGLRVEFAPLPYGLYRLERG